MAAKAGYGLGEGRVRGVGLAESLLAREEGLFLNIRGPALRTGLGVTVALDVADSGEGCDDNDLGNEVES